MRANYFIPQSVQKTKELPLKQVVQGRLALKICENYFLYPSNANAVYLPCCRLHVCAPPPPFICWNPNTQCNGVGKWGHIKGLGPLEEESMLSCKDTMRRRPSAKQEEYPQQTLDSFWTSQPPGLWKINICYLKHLINGNLLYQPKQTGWMSRLITPCTHWEEKIVLHQEESTHTDLELAWVS